jgi:hypothetical protein
VSREVERRKKHRETSRECMLVAVPLKEREGEDTNGIKNRLKMLWQNLSLLKWW